jgi:hypothetical protein
MADTKTAAPVDPRAVALLANPEKVRWGHMQLLFAFQTLALPKGCLLTRGFTRTMAANMINEFMGIKTVTNRTTVPRAPVAQALEHYVGWAITEAERRNKVTLDVVTIPTTTGLDEVIVPEGDITYH